MRLTKRVGSVWKNARRKTPISRSRTPTTVQRIVYVPERDRVDRSARDSGHAGTATFAWAYGTLQCLWKHRDMVFNWNYRALAGSVCPASGFSKSFSVAITRMVDFVPAASLPFASGARCCRSSYLPRNGPALATLACILERETNPARLAHLPMRLIYRPMLSYASGKQSSRYQKAHAVKPGANSSRTAVYLSGHNRKIRRVFDTHARS